MVPTTTASIIEGLTGLNRSQSNNTTHWSPTITQEPFTAASEPAAATISSPVLSNPELFNTLLIIVVTVTSVIFFLVMALILYVIAQAKQSNMKEKKEAQKEEDDVFVSESYYKRKRSVPIIRFETDSDDDKISQV